MANHKSSEKRARQTIKRTARNSARESQVRTAVKSLRAVIASGDKKAAILQLPIVQSLFDKLAKIGLIKRENAARKNGRLATQVASLK